MASSSSTNSLTMLESPIGRSDVRDTNSAREQRTLRRQQLQLQQSQRPKRADDAYSLSWSDDESMTGSNEDLVMSDAEPELYHAWLFSPQAAARQQQFRVLGTTGLMGLAFFVSSGGPIGSEPLMSAGGPLVGLICLACYVPVCVIPFAYVLAQLCSTFPENGGYTVWIMTVFGPFWGFQTGYWSWVAAVLTNAIYPGLVYSTVCDAVGCSMSATAAYFIKIAIACLLCVPSLMSVRFVAGAAFALLITICAIFVVFSTWAFVAGDNDWSLLLDVRTSNTGGAGGTVVDDVDWVLLMNTLFWNFDGFYVASIIGGEVANPARTYPRVLMLNVVVTVAMYLIPLVSAVTTNKLPWTSFDENSFPTIGDRIGGTGLKSILVVSSVLSLVGLFTTSIMLQSFQVLGMAQMRLLPAAFRTRHNTFKTPQYAILLSLLSTLLLLMFDYESILSLTNAFSAANQVLIVLTILRLRRVMPYITRPTKVPGGFAALCVVLVPTSATFLYIFFTTLLEPKPACVLCCLLVPGVVFGLVQRRNFQRELRLRARAQQQPTLVRQSIPELVER